EPLIAVVGSEAEARRLYLDLGARVPEARVSWEELPLIRDDFGTGEEGKQLHIVLQGADSWMPHDPAEMRDPIGASIHSTRDGAEEHAARLDDDSQRPLGVRSVPVGYRRAGWPFDPERPTPHDG